MIQRSLEKPSPLPAAKLHTPAEHDKTAEEAWSLCDEDGRIIAVGEPTANTQTVWVHKFQWSTDQDYRSTAFLF